MYHPWAVVTETSFSVVKNSEYNYNFDPYYTCFGENSIVTVFDKVTGRKIRTEVSKVREGD